MSLRPTSALLFGLFLATFLPWARLSTAQEAPSPSAGSYGHAPLSDANERQEGPESPQNSAMTPPTQAAQDDVRYLTACLALQNDALEDAIRILKELVSANPGDLRASLTLAEVYRKKGDRSGLLTTLATLAGQRPDVPAVRKALGEAALEAGNVPVAVRELRATTDLAPDDSEAWGLLGAALWRMEENQEAASAFARACAEDARYCGLSSLATAWQFYQAGAFSDALKSLDRPEGSEGFSSDQEVFFGDLRSAVYEAFSSDQRFSAFASFGAGIDTNPTYDPLVSGAEPDDGAPNTGEQSSSSAAALYALSAGLEATPILKGPHAAGGDINILRRHYVFDQVADDFDSSSVQAGARYRFVFSGLGFPQHILARYLFGLTLFDGGPLVDEENLYIFSESHTGVLRLTALPSGRQQIYLEARYGWQGFHDIRRVGTRLTLTLGGARFSLDKRLKAYANATLALDDTYIEAYDRLSPGAFLGISWLAPQEIDTAATLAYAHRDYVHSADYEPWDRQRVDQMVNVGLTASRKVWRSFRPAASLHFVRNLSTLDFYDYRKLTFQLSIGGEL